MRKTAAKYFEHTLPNKSEITHRVIDKFDVQSACSLKSLKCKHVILAFTALQ